MTRKEVRPENQLLLCCASVVPETARTEQIETLLQSDLDWEYILRMAYRHALIPRLFSSLQTSSSGKVPTTVLQQLRNDFHDNARYNLFMTAELCKLLSLFGDNNIPVIPYKGPVLALSIYNNLALRQFADLDVLVRQQDVLKVKELLLAHGYQPEYHFTPRQEAAYLYNQHCLPIKVPTTSNEQIYVEVHWRIVPRYFPLPLCPESLWERTAIMALGDTKVLTLSPENLLLVLSVHNGGQHGWERLGWLHDFARLVEQQQMDWSWILRRAEELSSMRILLLGLYLASHVLGVSLPEAVAHKVDSDSVLPSLAAQVCSQFFCDITSEPGALAHHFLCLKMRESWWNRMQYSLRVVFTPTRAEWTSLPLPDSLFFLYYPLRVLRLIGKYSWAVIQRKP